MGASPSIQAAFDADAPVFNDDETLHGTVMAEDSIERRRINAVARRRAAQLPRPHRNRDLQHRNTFSDFSGLRSAGSAPAPSGDQFVFPAVPGRPRTQTAPADSRPSKIIMMSIAVGLDSATLQNKYRRRFHPNSPNIPENDENTGNTVSRPSNPGVIQAIKSDLFRTFSDEFLNT